MQSQSPSQHPQPSVPPAYGYVPPVPPHRNAAPPTGNSDAQNWPGAYAPGGQVGPPNKKPRHQGSNVPAFQTTAPPYAPMGANMAGGAMGNYPTQQPYAWQAPHVSSASPMSSQPVPGPPGPPGAHGRAPSAGGIHPSAPGKGGVGIGGAGAASSRGMNRNGAQNRGNPQQKPSGQRAGLPANPTASVNAARAPNGQIRAWGSKAAGAPAIDAPSQTGRRVSSVSSVHSDKPAAAGSTKGSNFSSQNMIPPDAPRGPNNTRNKAATVSSKASTSGFLSNGSQGRRGSSVAATNTPAAGSVGLDVVGAGVSSAKDSGAGHKRAHTDFRILGLEIKQLDWSWFAPQALAKTVIDGPNNTAAPSAFEQNAKPHEGEGDDSAADVADDSTLVTVENADAVSARAKPSIEGDEVHGGTDRKQITDESPIADDDEANDENQDDDEEGLDDQDEVAEANANPEQGAIANADGDEVTHGDLDVDAEADAEGDAAMSHAETDTVASEHQESVAPTPEPSGELSKLSQKHETQQGKASKAECAKNLANLRDSTKLRICFAAVFNAAPEGAPTDSKPPKTQDAAIKVERSIQDEASVDRAEQNFDAAEGSEESKNDAPKIDIKAEEPNDLTEESSVQGVKEEQVAVSSESAQAGIFDEVVEPNESPVHADEGTPTAAGTKEVESSKEPDEAKAENKKELEAPASQVVEDAANTCAASKSKKTRSAVDNSPQTKGPPQLSSNRIFLSFAANRKRLAIDAEAVKSVKIHRSEHWVEIRINASHPTEQPARKKGEEYLVWQGTLLEKRGKGQDNYAAVTRSEIASAWKIAEAADIESSGKGERSGDEHLELPPFFRLDESASDLVLRVHLDASAPLPEPAWLRKNEVGELLASLQRSSTGTAGKAETAVSVAAAQHVWAGKIEVMDPDPPPSMSTFLYEWIKESFVGSQKDRRKFVDGMLSWKKKEHSSAAREKIKLERGAEAELGERRLKTQEGTMEKAEKESDSERDVRVARLFVDMVSRLIKGERATLHTDSATSHLARAHDSSSCTSTTYPGLFMLGLLDISLDSADAQAAKRLRQRIDEMLIEMPRATLLKAADLAFKDLDESASKRSAVAASTQSAPASRNRAHQPRHHHRRQHPGTAHISHPAGRHAKRKRA